MSSSIKLIPVNAGGKIFCKIQTSIDKDDGVRIENAVENTRCAVEALLYREGVYNDGSMDLACFKSSVTIRFKHKASRYSCYVSSDISQKDSTEVKSFVASVFDLVRELLKMVQEQSEAQND